MVSISKTVQQNLSNIDNVLTSNEQEMVRPYFLQKYIQEGRQEGRVEGLVEGIVIAIHKFMKKNPNMEVKQVAELFEVEIEIVEQARLLA
jgi:predicted transposase YdaD